MNKFDEMLDDDIDKVFFNLEEFGTDLVIDTDTDNPIICIFDTSTEVILDGGSEYGESAATVPSALMRKEDADKIEHSSSLEIEGKQYILNYKDEEDVDLVRVYLEKRR